MDSPNKIWYQVEDSKAAGMAVVETIKKLDNLQKTRCQDNLNNLRRYSNRHYTNLRASDPTGETKQPADRITFNVVSSVIDTAVAIIGTNKPRVSYMTSGGDYFQKLKAKNMTRFTDGLFSKLKVYKKSLQIFKDSCIFGTGCVKPFRRGNEILIERVFPDELLIDDTDGRFGDPRNLYQYYEIDKDVLANLYPDNAGEILTSGCFRANSSFTKGASNPVGVGEAWHLPSSPDAKDGRHIITVEKNKLLDEPWSKDRFPILRFFYENPPIGSWGIGLSEILRPTQIELNYLLQKIQRSMTQASSKVFLNGGTELDEQSINNQDWGIVRYNGQQAPVLAVVQSIAPEYFQQVETLIHRAYEISGVSMMSAQAKKPAGLDAGRAIREFNDIQSQRFAAVSENWEFFFVELSEAIIDLAGEITDSEGSFKVNVKDKGSLKEIDFKKIKLDKDEYVIDKFPTGYLSKTPSGKLSDIQELVQAFPEMKPYALRLLGDMPDLESVIEQLTSSTDVIEMVKDLILTESTYIEPEKYMDLKAGIQYMQLSYLHAVKDKVEETKLQLIRNWIDQAASLLEQAAQEVAASQQAPQMPTAAIAGPEALGLPAQQGPVMPAGMMPGSTGIEAAIQPQ